MADRIDDINRELDETNKKADEAAKSISEDEKKAYDLLRQMNKLYISLGNKKTDNYNYLKGVNKLSAEFKKLDVNEELKGSVAQYVKNLKSLRNEGDEVIFSFLLSAKARMGAIKPALNEANKVVTAVKESTPKVTVDPDVKDMFVDWDEDVAEVVEEHVQTVAEESTQKAVAAVAESASNIDLSALDNLSASDLFADVDEGITKPVEAKLVEAGEVTGNKLTEFTDAAQEAVNNVVESVENVATPDLSELPKSNETLSEADKRLQSVIDGLKAITDAGEQGKEINIDFYKDLVKQAEQIEDASKDVQEQFESEVKNALVVVNKQKLSDAVNKVNNAIDFSNAYDKSGLKADAYFDDAVEDYNKINKEIANAKKVTEDIFTTSGLGVSQELQKFEESLQANAKETQANLGDIQNNIKAGSDLVGKYRKFWRYNVEAGAVIPRGDVEKYFETQSSFETDQDLLGYANIREQLGTVFGKDSNLYAQMLRRRFEVDAVSARNEFSSIVTKLTEQYKAGKINTAEFSKQVFDPNESIDSVYAAILLETKDRFYTFFTDLRKNAVDTSQGTGLDYSKTIETIDKQQAGIGSLLTSNFVNAVKDFSSTTEIEFNKTRKSASYLDLYKQTRDAIGSLETILETAEASGADTNTVQKNARTELRELYQRFGVYSDKAIKDFISSNTDLLNDLATAISEATDEGQTQAKEQALSNIRERNADVYNIIRDAKQGTTTGDIVARSIKKYVDNTQTTLFDEAVTEAENKVKRAKLAFEHATSKGEKTAAYESYVGELQSLNNLLNTAPEGINTESDIIKIQEDIIKANESYDKWLNSLSEGVKDALDAVSKNLGRIKADKSLSTEEKIAAAKGLQGTLGGISTTTSGDKEAINAANIDLQDYIKNLEFEKQAKERNLQVTVAVQRAEQDLANTRTPEEKIAATRNLADVYRELARTATDAAEKEKLLTQAAKADASADQQTAALARQIQQETKQATQQVLSSVNSIVNGITSTMSKMFGMLRSGLSLLNKAINFTVNSLRSIVTGAQKVIQLFGNLSNRVRSFVGNLLNGNRAGQETNIIVRSIGLTFTELNSAISLVERAFNALFNNQMLERAMKFDSTIASITMLLGDTSVADVRDFADALQTGFGVPATKTISDLQEVTSLLKGVGIQTEYIANASEDLYSMANYMAALGMAGGDVSTVMTKLQSGLKGMTQSIDDLGLSVRESQMDAFLKENRVNVKFSGLSEANREIVRLASIIAQFRKGFDISDYPKLMQNTYFQVSLIKSQFTEIGTLIGKIFEGLIGKILPFIMKALAWIKSTIISVGEFLGIDMGFGDTESQVSNAAEAVNDVTDSTKEATDATKDLTKATKEYTGAAGFDKLESLSSSKSGSGSGSGSDGDDGLDLSYLLEDVGSISDELIKLSRDSDGFMSVVEKRIKKALKSIKEDVQEFADELLGHKVDLSFGFDKDSAKTSLDGIWENVKTWWNSISDTGLYLGFRFAEDIQIGRLSNDLLSILESITSIIATIQTALEPVIKELYDEYLSPIVKDIGDGIHNFADGLAGLADVIEAMFSGDKSLADVQKMIDDLSKTHPKFAKLAESILTIKENWKGFIDIWNGKDTKESKTLEEAFPTITQLEKTIKSITELTSTLWSDYLKPLFKHIRKNMPTPEQLLTNLQDAVDSINQILGKDSTKITITDAASSVLEMITTKAKALKKVLKGIGKIAISLVTPTDENGNVASKENGGTSVLSLLADSMSEFEENEFSPWIEEVTTDISNFIKENKDDIVKILDDLRDFAWDAFKTVVQKIINLFKWVVTNESTVKKVLNNINRAFKFVVNNAEDLISVFVALKGLQKIASRATAIVSVLNTIKKLKGVGGVASAASEEAASVISASTIKIAGKATILATTAMLGYEVGKEFGEAFLDIGERLADLKTKYDDKAMTDLLATLYAEATTGTVESMKAAQDELKKNFKLTVEDLKPFEYKDKYGIPQLDMTKLSVDGVGTVRTIFQDHEILASAYQQSVEEAAKVADKDAKEAKKEEERRQRQNRTNEQKIAAGVNGIPSDVAEMSKDIITAIKNNLKPLKTIKEGVNGMPSYIKETTTAIKQAFNPDTGGKATAETERAKGEAHLKETEKAASSKRSAARDLLKSPTTTAMISEDPKAILNYLDAFKSAKQKKIKDAVKAYTDAISRARDEREADSALKKFKESLHTLKIPGFASGGSIGKGNLFIANENGTATELVGNITRKSGTDIANNKMITDAMEAAVYNGFADAFNQLRQNGSTPDKTTQTINISGFGMIDKTTLKRFAQMLAPYLDANSKALYTS